MAPQLQSTQEIAERLANPERAIELHREALQEGMPLSRYLEVIDPTPDGERLDAFGRQLRSAGIVTRSNPKAGWWSSPAISFFETVQGRSLYPEWYARQWREVMYSTPQERAILLSSDAVLNTWERPYVDAASPAWNNQFAPAIPLAELVAQTTPISGEDYRALYLTYDEDALRLFRIGESAEIPMATLTSSERVIRLKKYGRGLRATYEQLRRARIDKLAQWVRWQALQAEVDKVTAAMDVIISGDGNSGTAATVIDLTDLDADATPTTLTLKAWLRFRMSFAQPYTMTTALGEVDPILQLILLNSGSANVPLAGLNLAGVGNTLIPINRTADGIRYGWTEDAPTNQILGFDNRFALEHLVEVGSEIRETERFITNQTEVMTMTENSGFSVIDPAASKLLNLTA